MRRMDKPRCIGLVEAIEILSEFTKTKFDHEEKGILEKLWVKLDVTNIKTNRRTVHDYCHVGWKITVETESVRIIKIGADVKTMLLIATAELITKIERSKC